MNQRIMASKRPNHTQESNVLFFTFVYQILHLSSFFPLPTSFSFLLYFFVNNIYTMPSINGKIFCFIWPTYTEKRLQRVILSDINNQVKGLHKMFLLSETCPSPLFQKWVLSSFWRSQACSTHDKHQVITKCPFLSPFYQNS